MLVNHRIDHQRLVAYKMTDLYIYLVTCFAWCALTLNRFKRGVILVLYIDIIELEILII